MQPFRHLPLAAAAVLLLAGPASAESFVEDFSSYNSDTEMGSSWYTFVYPTASEPGAASGTAMLDSTNGAVILTAEQAGGGDTFTLTQLLELKHKHRLGSGRTVAVEAEFDDAGNVPVWAPEPIAPSRVGLSGDGATVWGQVGVVKQNDPVGTLVAKVAVDEAGGGGERMVKELSSKGFGTYDGRDLRLVVGPETIDLLVDGNSVIGGPQPHDIDWSGKLGKTELQAFVQQQRVYAPQPRSSTVYRVAVEESDASSPAAPEKPQ